MTTRSNEATKLCVIRQLGQLAMFVRISIVRAVCLLFLPRDVWVGKHFGSYTQRWSIALGRLDDRGVLQGVLDSDIGA